MIGIVCGMAAEARALGAWARDPRVAIAISGGRPDRAEAEARRLVATGVRALLSWGIAGALDPAPAPGALLRPGRVLCPDGTVHALDAVPLDAVLLDAVPLDAAPPGGTLLAGSDTLVLEPAAKAALRRRTGAVAVDMESHRVAAVAAEAGLPCFVVRAISDPAGRALPALAASALGPDGRPRLGAVVAGLVRRPGDLPALVSAARDSRAALVALGGAADAVMAALLAGVPAGR